MVTTIIAEREAPRIKRTFHNLDPVKQKRFFDACAAEFAEYGYELASTNRIVGTLGIAKGSFFKYAESKEDVFLYLVRQTLEELGRIQASPATYSSADLLVRARELLIRHVDYAADHPARYRMVLRAYLDTRSPLYPKLAELRAAVSAASGNAIYDGVDWGIYRFPREEVVTLLELFDRGLRQAILEAHGDLAEIGDLERSAIQAFDLLRRVLRDGIYRDETRRDDE